MADSNNGVIVASGGVASAELKEVCFVYFHLLTF